MGELAVLSFAINMVSCFLSSLVGTRVRFFPGAEVQPGDEGVGAGQHCVCALGAGEGVRGDALDVTVVTDDA